MKAITGAPLLLIDSWKGEIKKKPEWGFWFSLDNHLDSSELPQSFRVYIDKTFWILDLIGIIRKYSG